MTEILGLAMLYSWGHFVLIQHSKRYAKRTEWEKIVTWFAIIAFVFFLIGTLE